MADKTTAVTYPMFHIIFTNGMIYHCRDNVNTTVVVFKSFMARTAQCREHACVRANGRQRKQQRAHR
jgi:hypothetical protein